MPKLVNLTPHVLNIHDEDKMLASVLPPERVPARVSVGRKMVRREAGIPVYETTYGQVENLPAPEPETIFIVSFMVSNAVPDRMDVLSPGELLRNEEGQPIGCIGLAK